MAALSAGLPTALHPNMAIAVPNMGCSLHGTLIWQLQSLTWAAHCADNPPRPTPYQAKCLSEVIEQLGNGINIWLYTYTYLTLTLFATETAVWLYRLTIALTLYEPLFIIPLLQVRRSIPAQHPSTASQHTDHHFMKPPPH